MWKWVDKGYKALFVIYAPVFIIYIVVSTLFGSAVSAMVGYLPPWLIYVIYVAGGSFLIVGFTAYLRHVYRNSKRQNSRTLFGYPNVLMISSESTLVCKGDNKYTYSRRLILKGTEDGVTSFRLPFDYGGALSNVSVTGASGATVNVIHPTDSTKYAVFLDFTPALQKGQERDISYTIEVDDQQSKMRKFFSHVCMFPVEKYIRIAVKFEGAAVVPASPRLRLFRSALYESSEDSPLSFQNGRLEFVMNSPVVGRKYRIEWD